MGWIIGRSGDDVNADRAIIVVFTGGVK